MNLTRFRVCAFGLIKQKPDQHSLPVPNRTYPTAWFQSGFNNRGAVSNVCCLELEW